MLRLSSDPKNVECVEPFVEKLVEKYHISPDMYGNILISLTEAVNNAIRHGNCNDQNKTVKVSMQEVSENKITFQVSDEGPGFDFDSVPDPTSPENLLKIGGRGVFLMRQLCDDIRFHDNGSTVEIQFNI
ncbi:MAG: ATP-binding protein [Saprospiraceae bacterium]